MQSGGMPSLLSRWRHHRAIRNLYAKALASWRKWGYNDLTQRRKFILDYARVPPPSLWRKFVWTLEGWDW